MLKRLNLKDLSYFLIGIIFLTLGIRIIGVSNLGLSFSDAIPIKLSELLKIPVSLSSLMLGIFTLLVASVIKKSKIPQFECLITSFVLGFFIDFWLFVIPDIYFEGLLLSVSVFVLGAFVLSLGISIYLQPNKYPPHPNDLLLMAVTNRFNFSILKSKILIDSMYAAIAILLLAPIGIGSVFNTICLGFFINKLFDFFEKKNKKKC